MQQYSVHTEYKYLPQKQNVRRENGGHFVFKVVGKSKVISALLYGKSPERR